MEKFEKKEQSSIEWNDEEEFQRYVEDLRLRPEDFDKKILDVGAGAAQFAKWAKDHNLSNEIYSLDPEQENLINKDKRVVAVAEAIPFADESFDLVVSSAALPNVYISEKENDVSQKVKDSFNEMVRVVKPGGEIRLARVLSGKEYEPQRILSGGLESTLDDLEKQDNIRIEKIRTPINDTYEYEDDKPKKLLAEAYLIVIHKQK